MPYEEKKALLETITRQAEEIRNLREQVKYMEEKEEQARQDADALRDELRKLKGEEATGEESSRQPEAEGSHRRSSRTKKRI